MLCPGASNRATAGAALVALSWTSRAHAGDVSGLEESPELSRAVASQDGPAISSADHDVEIAPSHPQFSLGLTLGATISDLRAPDLHDKLHGGFAMGLRGDVVLLRNKEQTFGVGPYFDVTTQRFQTLEAGGGVSFLVPVIASVPIVLSGGALARSSENGVEPALSGRLFFGPRGYNFHSNYAMANGIFVDVRYGIAGSRQADVLIGARIDFEVLTLPFLYLFGTAKGRRTD